MSDYKAALIRSHKDRSERRFKQKAAAVACRIQDLMGSMKQKDLVDRVGKEASTISEHLSGEENLTLRTIAEYETALDGNVVSVPELERSGRRRRRDSGEDRRVSEERKAVKEIDPSKRRLYHLANKMSMFLRHLIQKQGAKQSDLADRIGKDPSYVSRVLGGGVNLTLKTIVQFEEALGECILQVEGVPLQGTFTGTREASDYVQPYRSSNDGCYLDDNDGPTSTGMDSWLEAGNASCASDEPETMAA